MSLASNNWALLEVEITLWLYGASLHRACMVLHCTEPFSITLPSSQYHLNNVKRDVKHQPSCLAFRTTIFTLKIVTSYFLIIPTGLKVWNNFIWLPVHISENCGMSGKLLTPIRCHILCYFIWVYTLSSCRFLPNTVKQRKYDIHLTVLYNTLTAL